MTLAARRHLSSGQVQRLGKAGKLRPFQIIPLTVWRHVKPENRARLARWVAKTDYRAGAQAVTPRDRQILDFICSFIESRGYPPTNAEIREAVGLRDGGCLSRHLRRLVKHRFLWIGWGRSRCIRVTRRSDGMFVRVAIVPRTSP
jgi:hypothetical protein